MAAMTALLSKYPGPVIRAVCNPESGLPRRHKFLPTIAELGECLDIAQSVLVRPAIRAAREEKPIFPVEHRNKISEKLSVMLKNLGAGPQLKDGESRDVRDHADKDGTINWETATKFNMKAFDSRAKRRVI